ncbi:unnamed protein product [Darwinula stevensoni]|uniref:Sodium/calcium exchanger membrane region domain-containing protein n=1 Tax=Darwinula stevensoni TaxID=69355 RepID=A0A7R8ZXB1_9CRUS|nr:unnamed protein product [Darwinula stevensoni]CAG0879004.1 unnamed protein product [Darwinula stevensoni]
MHVEAVVRSRHLLSQNSNCTPPAIEEFPPDFLSPSQRSRGGIIIHFLIGIYLFLGIAIACDEYFVPSLDVICDELDLSSDVGGASFMAAGSSSPELFTNLLGTFVTEGDVGLGTVVGSAVFNILGVVTLCGLFAGMVIPVDFWALSRDCAAYGVSVIILILVINDELVVWWEALILFFAYFLYVIGKPFPDPPQKLIFHLLCHNPFPVFFFSNALDQEEGFGVGMEASGNPRFGGRRRTDTTLVQSGFRLLCRIALPYFLTSFVKAGRDSTESSLEEGEKSEPVAICNGWCPPGLEEEEGSISTGWRIYWILTWPIRFLMFLTIPDCRKKNWRKFYILAFLCCILWIGGLSYLVVWMITIIGRSSPSYGYLRTGEKKQTGPASSFISFRAMVHNWDNALRWVDNKTNYDFFIPEMS